ncbi:MAG TPA: GNAT family N-acetyltransferase [Fimbriimonadaceae bacterium]|nr:GNAT family N-acetyltransferase [Fimbriimonadaceae bacterium]
MLRANRVAQAIESNHAAMWQLIVDHVPWTLSERKHGLTATSLKYPHRMFNFASMADIPSGRIGAAIGFAESFFAKLDVPWTWMTGPLSRPANLPRHLLTAGFTFSHSTPGMALDLRGWQTREDAAIREVVGAGSLEIWMEALCAAFKMPPDVKEMFRSFHGSAGWSGLPMRSFYLEEGGFAAACSTVFFGSGVAGIYNVGVVPEARQRGFGERITRACIHAALEAGWDIAILHSSRMGLPLYEKLGFREYCKLSYYLPPTDGLA